VKPISRVEIVVTTRQHVARSILENHAPPPRPGRPDSPGPPAARPVAGSAPPARAILPSTPRNGAA